MASEERITVKLLGGSPWGFRLTGGAGTGQPLIVNKIRRKSKAQHQLKEGDFVLGINGVKCQTLTYDDAMNVVDEATDCLIIEILRAKPGKENVAPQAQTQQQPQRVAAKTPEIAPLNQKENYSVVENTTKTFVEDQRLQSSSIQQQETSSSSISQTQQIQQETKTTQIEQNATTNAPKTSFFPQTKFSVPKPAEMVASQESTVQQFQQSQQVQHTFQQQETQQTQFYQENFQHPQFQLPQKPHAPTQPLLPPVQHPEFPQPQSPLQSRDQAPQLQQLPPEPLYQMPPEPLYEMPPQQTSPQQQFQQQQQSPQQQFQQQQSSPQQQFQQQQSSPQQQFQQKPSPQQQFQQQQPSPQQQFQQQQPSPQQQFQHPPPPPPPHKLQQQPMEPLFQPQPQPFQVPLIAPTFNAKTSLLSSLPGPKPFQAPSGDIGAQEKTVSFEQTSDDKHFHQLKTEATRQKTDNSETQTFIREEQSFTRDGGGPTETAEDLKPEIESKPSKPVSSIIQDLEEATRDFNRVAEAMSSTSLSNTSKSIESSSSLYQVSKFESKEATSVESHSMWRPTSPIFNQPIEPPNEFKGQTTQHDSTRDNAQSSQRFESNSEFNESKISSSVSTSEFYSSSTATNAYQPSPEADEMGSTSLLSRRRKMYTSSSFYEEPGQIYPTVEEQVELCRKIADSLSADTNKKSKGANMFYKRVKRSHKWVHESGFDPYSSDGNTTDSERDMHTPDLASAPYIKVSKGPPKLKLIMAPREIIDMQKLRSSGQLVNEHNVISPDICMDIVRDLNSPRGRGAALFAKRKQRAEDWVVDEEKVKAKTEARKASMATLEQLSDVFPPPVALNPRVKLVKSPWEAAMESPIGSCDAAFVELPPVVGNFMAHTIIQAAENKLASTSPEGFDQSTEYHPPGHKRPEPIYKPVAPVSIDIYRPKAPKGWKGTTQESVPTNRVEPELAPFAPQAAQPVTSSSNAQSEAGHQALSRVPTTAPRPQSFHDFNTIPRSWTKVKSNPPNRTASFRPVQPPSTHF